MSKFRLRNRGFSLLEVLLAVAIFSAGTVFVVQAISFCSRITGLSSDMVRAIFMAQDKMQEWHCKEGLGLLAKETPYATETKDKFTCRYSLAKEPDLNTLYRASVEILWERGNRNESIRLETWLKE